MNKLKLPVIKYIPPSRKHLSMDDYLEFVTFNLKKNMTQSLRKAIKKQKRMPIELTPFKI